MAARRGRPAIPPAKRKQTISISLLPADIKKLDGWCRRHGVNRSQIIYDAIRSLEGTIQEDLAHLRQELADQQATTKRMEAIVSQMKTELDRLQSSQDLADAVISPYRSPDSSLTKAEKERARTMRAVLNNPNGLDILRALADERLQHPPIPIFQALKTAWGSYAAALEAAEALRPKAGEA